MLASILYVPSIDHIALSQCDEQFHDVRDNLFQIIARNQDAQICIVVMRQKRAFAYQPKKRAGVGERFYSFLLKDIYDLPNLSPDFRLISARETAFVSMLGDNVRENTSRDFTLKLVEGIDLKRGFKRA